MFLVKCTTAGFIQVWEIDRVAVILSSFCVSRDYVSFYSLSIELLRSFSSLWSTPPSCGRLSFFFIGNHIICIPDQALLSIKIGFPTSQGQRKKKVVFFWLRETPLPPTSPISVVPDILCGLASTRNFRMLVLSKSSYFDMLIFHTKPCQIEFESHRNLVDPTARVFRSRQLSKPNPHRDIYLIRSYQKKGHQKPIQFLDTQMFDLFPHSFFSIQG